MKEKYKWVTRQDYEAIAGPDWPDFDVFSQHTNVPDVVYNEVDSMLAPASGFDHPSFCVLPFFGIELPEKTPCCLLTGPFRIDEIRHEMLKGHRPQACQKCWAIEDQGQLSDRLIKNSTLDFYAKKNINDLFDQCVTGMYDVISYKIDTSNTCNATCVSCNSKFSTSWGKILDKNNLPSSRPWSKTLNDVAQDINFKTAKSIVFRGGEPFLSDTNFDILEQLVVNDNADCFVSFTTNGSFKLSKKHKRILKEFKNLNFCFSIDGVGPVFEYLRYPLKFDVIKQNVEYCKENNIDASVSYTLSNLNILYHNQTVEWFKKMNLPYLLNPVYHPSCFSPSALPRQAKEFILANYQTPEIESFLNTHLPQNEMDFNQFCNVISQQDALKEIQMQDYLPEFTALIKL